MRAKRGAGAKNDKQTTIHRDKTRPSPPPLRPLSIKTKVAMTTNISDLLSYRMSRYVFFKDFYLSSLAPMQIEFMY